MVPVAYTPNNDLYISADQGGFEITNVHPDNNLYTELVLRQNWSGTGKTLLSIKVAEGPRVIGMEGIFSWPTTNIVNHNDITEEVKIIFDDVDIEATIKLSDIEGNETSIDSIDGVITIPYSYLENSLSRRLVIELTVNSSVVSSIKCLPRTESEPFSFNGYLSIENGEFVEANNYNATDFINVEFARDILWFGVASQSMVAALCAYDSNKEFVKVLIEHYSGSQVQHVTPDGTYQYIRACARNSYSMSCSLVFPDRRIRVSK